MGAAALLIDIRRTRLPVSYTRISSSWAAVTLPVPSPLANRPRASSNEATGSSVMFPTKTPEARLSCTLRFVFPGARRSEMTSL